MFYKDNSKERLLEVMTKVDPKLNENYENFHDTSVPPGQRPPQPLRPEGGPTQQMIDDGKLEEEVGRNTEQFGQVSGTRMWEYLMKNLSEDFKEKIMANEDDFQAFIKGVIWGVENESSQFGADIFAKNAGAAPDEMV